MKEREAVKRAVPFFRDFVDMYLLERGWRPEGFLTGHPDGAHLAHQDGFFPHAELDSRNSFDHRVVLGILIQHSTDWKYIHSYMASDESMMRRVVLY